MKGITNAVRIVKKNINLTLNIPLNELEIFENVFVKNNIIPSRNIIILLLLFPNDFLKHSDDKFKNIDNFINIPDVHKPR